MSNMREEADIRKLKGTIGLARKAGTVISGTDAVIDGVRKRKVLAVYAASDISEQTEKKLCDKTAFYQIPMYALPFSMNALSDCIGSKKLTAAVGLTNKNFIEMIGDIAEKDDNTVNMESE